MQLFVNEPGSSISIENGRYCVKKKDACHYFPTYEVASIYLHKGVSITHEALLLAIENETDLLVVGQFDKPVGRVWGEKPGTISTVRKNQLAFASSNEPRGKWIVNLLHHKIEQQVHLLDLLACMYPEEERRLAATIDRMERMKAKINFGPEEDVDALKDKWRGHEGNASRIYFEALSSLLPEEYRFEKRSRPARDRFNAMLNYTYGILYSKVEGALLRAGLDPYIGVFHRDEYNRPSLVYDVIERYRVWADYVVFHLCMQQVMHLEFFEDDPGGYMKMDDHARRMIVRSFFDYLEEIVEIDQLERSRLVHIDLHCQQLATFFKNLKP